MWCPQRGHTISFTRDGGKGVTEQELRDAVIDTATGLLVLDLAAREGGIPDNAGVGMYWRKWKEVRFNVTRVLMHVTIRDARHGQDIVHWVVRLAREFQRAAAAPEKKSVTGC